MRSGSCIASKADYDCYTMHLPFSVILKKKRINYIRSQLEKLHPCFSKDMTIKSRLKLKRGGVVSDVVVMNSYKLEEYHNRYPGRKIWLNEVQDTFEDFGKKKRLLRLCILFLVLAGLLTISYFSIDSQSIEENVDETLNSGVVASEKMCAAKDILQIIADSKSLITHLEIIADDKGESFSFITQGLYPEALFDYLSLIELSQTDYINGIPNLTVKSSYSPKNNLIHQIDIQKFILFRDLLKLYGCQIVNESLENSHIKVKLQKSKELEDVLEKLKEKLLECNCGVRKIKIDSGKADELLMEIIFEDNSLVVPFDGIKGDLFKRNMTEELPNVSSSKKVQIFQRQEKLDGKMPGVKLGEIQRKNGTTVTFYKTPAGKIIKEEK